MKPSLLELADERYDLGMLGLDKPDLSGIYYTPLFDNTETEVSTPVE